MPSTKNDSPSYAVESVDNALRILLMLCDAREVRVTEVADRLGVANSTAHRLLSMLVHHGFAMQNGRGREYRTGPALLEMGFAAIRDMDIRRHARPVLEAVRDRVNETVHLVLPYGREVFYVECVESHRPLRVASRVGSFLPAHSIAAGKALLATFTKEELLSLYPEGQLPARTSRSVTSRKELLRQLDKIKLEGYARSRGESEDDVGSIAIAVTDARGLGRAAISVSAPTSRITAEAESSWIAATRLAAAELGTRLWGGQPAVG